MAQGPWTRGKPVLAVAVLASLPVLVGCYPIEKVYERTERLKDGQQSFESISKIKIDEATKTGALVRYFDSPELKFDQISNEWFYTGKRSKSATIGKLENCSYIDRSNWSCNYEEIWELEMVEGKLRWKTGAANVPYNVIYRFAF